MHAPGVSWHKLALNKKSHRYRIQHRPSPPTYQAPKKHQYVMPPHTACKHRIPGRRRKRCVTSSLPLLRTKTEDGPSTRRAAIRACKYLRVMVNQHGPTSSQHMKPPRSTRNAAKGSAATAMQYRPKELPVKAPELTSELLHCRAAHQKPAPGLH